MSFRIRPALPSDREPVAVCLRAEKLPLQGLDEHFASFLVAEVESRVVAAAGLELHGDYGLVRSVVVASPHRRRGIAEQLVRAQIDEASKRQLRALYLLTLNAEPYFARLGFELIEREQVPPPVKRSHEFAGACPASAHAMSLTLAGH
jgi:N-acetylglutamate synthase-like GNAT family acetyltransferase